ncbi:MAG: hypothetical protein WD844_08520 [Thermoleophilaceae bacterium]
MGGRIAWLVAGLVVLAPGAAWGATAASVYQQSFPGTPAFLYTAAPGEANRVSLASASLTPQVVVVRDAVAITTDTCVPALAGAVCTSLLHRDVAAGLPGVSIFPWGYGRVDLGDGDDRLQTRGLAVAGGLDVLGGEGDDVLDVAGGALEFVRCGPGTDTVIADPGDVVDSTCEHVSR